MHSFSAPAQTTIGDAREPQMVLLEAKLVASRVRAQFRVKLWQVLSQYCVSAVGNGASQSVHEPDSRAKYMTCRQH